MAIHAFNRVVQHLRQVAARQDGEGLADSELLDSYVKHADAAAFEALLRRHGPMVLGVCRRILRNEADTEDAFQATFLVLVRKAGSIRPRGMVSNWLYGVARNTSLKAREMIDKRRAKEKQAATMPRPEPAEDVWRQVQTALDAELSQLPDKYRVPIVLCELEGKTIKEAARHLGWPQGTVATRLAKGRRMLAERLTGHGLSLSAGALTAMISQGAASASVPASLLGLTVKAASVFAAGHAATGVINAQVAALTEGVLKTMLIAKLKVVGALLSVAAVATLGVGGQIVRPANADERSQSMPVAQNTNDAPKTDWESERQKALLRLRQAEAELQLRKAEIELERAKAAVIDAREQVQKAKPAPAKQGHIQKLPDIGGLFKYRIPFEIGFTQFKDGNRIEILEVWGTRPKIEVGGQYIVRGKYTLAARERGKLYFYETEDGSDNSAPEIRAYFKAMEKNWNSGNTLDLQNVSIPADSSASASKSGSHGEFTLMHGMAVPGWLHVMLMSEGRDGTLANVYFGTGDTVYRKK
jgi:RNA polymerase sigma factor (sigma-70 family)